MARQRTDRQKKNRVGIPRALLFYKFEAMWTTFFETLGAEVVLSPKTTKQMKEKGLKLALDDDCYSTKLYFGHVLDLLDKVDYLFMPRFASRKKREVGCPKFIALADIIKATQKEHPEIIGPYFSTSRERHGPLKFLQIVFQIGWKFTKNPFRILRAMRKGLKADKQYLENLHINEETFEEWERSDIFLNDKPILEEGNEMLKVALVGHSYVLNDPFASLETRKKLKKLGIDIITSEQMPRSLIQKQMTRLRYEEFGLHIKDIENITKEEHEKFFLGRNDYLYFEFEHEIVGTAMHFLESNTIDGVLMLVNFICGPVSVSTEYVKQFAKRVKSETPLMIITLDAHTGEAGFMTRLEAFSDILRTKKVSEDRKVITKEEEVPLLAH